MMTTEEIIDAAKAGDASRIERILRERPDLAAARAQNGETPLMAALYRGHHGIVESLAAAIEGGGGLDVFSAAATGREEPLRAALGGGGVNAFAYDGWTALHLAAFFGRRGAAELLLGAGADVNAISTNALRNTPLHAATAGGHADVALLLIERGAQVDIADAGGHTPLHIAAESGSVPVVEALLARGADPYAVDDEEKTPLSRAASRNHTTVVDLLNLHTAKHTGAGEKGAI
jgi:ankyrin repeat protein